MTTMHRFFLCITLLLTATGTSLAQRGPEPPPRPRLKAQADTNDWEAYYDFAVSKLSRNVPPAQAGMYWASRLRPDRAEPLFGRWITFWLRDPARFAKYLQGDETVWHAPDVRHADTLRMRALARNPFVHQELTMVVYSQLPGRWGDDIVTRAWFNYFEARLPLAAEQFGRAISRDPARARQLRFPRATILLALGQPGSALAELTTLLAALRADEGKHRVGIYEPKDMLEYAIGLLHAHRGNQAEAAGALQRAVTENMAFAPAHVALARLALQRRDTALALQEIGLAVELDSLDAVARLAHGDALRQAMRMPEALAAYRAAIRIEPYYADARLRLADALDATKDAGAVAAYADFVSLAPWNHPHLARVRQRLAATADGR